MTRRNLPMCMCCAARQETYGIAKGGAGPASRSEGQQAAHPAPERTERGRSRSDSRDSDRRLVREGRAGPSRPPPHPVDLPPRRDEGRERGVKRPRRQWIPCLVPGCKRGADDPHAICCDQCGRTAGTLHSQRCNERARESLGPTWDDDDNYEDDDEDWDDPPPKKGKGGTKKKARRWNAARFQAALKLGTAENTTKSVNSRLTTWDRTMRLLEEKEVIPPTDSPQTEPPSAEGRSSLPQGTGLQIRRALHVGCAVTT